MSGLTMRSVEDLAMNDGVLYAATSGGGVFRLDRLAMLSVTKIGTGTGNVLSNPAGVDCGSSCMDVFTPGIGVDLTALGAIGSVFSGWSGACSGTTNPCSFIMNIDKSVSASFDAVAEFTAPTSGFSPLLVSFTDQSGNSPTSWLWDFGDGGTSTAQNPIHLYKIPGVYTVTLTASNGAGSLIATKTDYITVTACPNGRVKVSTAYYGSINGGYTDPAGGLMELQAADFTEAVILNQHKVMTLRGGSNCDYTGIVGQTVVRGSLTVQLGTATIDGVVIK
jgi:phage baseplate assembly protein gpV